MVGGSDLWEDNPRPLVVRAAVAIVTAQELLEQQVKVPPEVTVKTAVAENRAAAAEVGGRGGGQQRGADDEPAALTRGAHGAAWGMGIGDKRTPQCCATRWMQLKDTSARTRSATPPSRQVALGAPGALPADVGLLLHDMRARAVSAGRAAWRQKRREVVMRALTEQ